MTGDARRIDGSLETEVCVRIADYEVTSDCRAIIAEIRSRIAAQVADAIMVKIGPHLHAAFQETTGSKSLKENK